jgi:hypothetical protein
MHLTYRLALAIGAAACSAQAAAAERTATLSGSALAIESPCARHVDIQPDPARHGSVTVQATAANQQEIDRLVFESSATARIHTVKAGCWQPESGTDFSPTLNLTVRVPAGFDLSVSESDAGDYVIGPLGGKLALGVSGESVIQAASSRDLTLDLSGDGTIGVIKAAGSATVAMSGHGKLTIEQAALEKFKLSLSGAGSIDVVHGSIADATLDASGAGNMMFGAEVGQATVDISGAAAVHFAKLSGSITKDISGSGTVTVGE